MPMHVVMRTSPSLGRASHGGRCPGVHDDACPFTRDSVRPSGVRQQRAPISRQEQGFTLIELIVAMVLLAIALGMVSVFVLQSISGGTGARSGAASDAAIAAATVALEDDVAAAVTEDRRSNKLRDRVEFAQAVRSNGVARSNNPSDAGRVLDIDDILVATPSELQLRADVDAAAGVECVTWRASTTNGYRVERLVSGAGGCGTGSLSRRTHVSAPAGVTGLTATPFSYQLLCHRSSCPGSLAPASAPCRPWTSTNAAGGQRRWVVGVSARFVNVTSDKAVAKASGSASIAVRSRDTESYRKALGC
ncbi:MAG: hypothetical protein JWM90_2732 [Thermoleophilia bacterium]|nr:hypothetical protein [Thermoleophilia bacterium]